MRTYGSIQTSFWTHRDVIDLSDQAKLLAAYLLSSPHTNMLGCFRIPIGYITEDLRWNNETTTKALSELSSIDFLTFDAENNWIIIHHFLKYHPIENPNQGRSVVKLFEAIPKNLIFISRLINSLLQQTKHLDEAFCKRIETLSKLFRNQEQDQEQNKEQKQEGISGKPDIVTLTNLSFEKLTSQQSLLKSQALEVLGLQAHLNILIHSELVHPDEIKQGLRTGEAYCVSKVGRFHWAKMIVKFVQFDNLILTKLKDKK